MARTLRRTVNPIIANLNFGLALSGGEFNSNSAGTIDQDYTFYDNAEIASIATKFPGTILRLSTSISRLCPTTGSVNSTKGTELTTVMTRAANNGLRVLVDLHDGGAKWVSGTERKIGSAQYTQANFVSDLTAIATYLKDHTALWGIGLSNEPNNMPVVTDSSNYNTTSTWTLAANAGTAAIKGVSSAIKTVVCTDNYSGFQNLVSTYPTNPFTNTDYVEIHAYFDSTNEGFYQNANAYFSGSSRDVRYGGDTLSDCIAWARSNSTKLLIGEVGIPSYDEGYFTMLNDFYKVAATNSDVVKAIFYWAKRTGWYVSITGSTITDPNNQSKIYLKYTGTQA